MKKHSILQLPGWLFVAAGFVNVAVVFAGGDRLFALGGMAFFVAAIIFFWRSRVAKKEHDPEGPSS